MVIFRGDKDKLFTFGHVLLDNGALIKYHIETGKASMVMIHGVKIAINLSQVR